MLIVPRPRLACGCGSLADWNVPIHWHYVCMKTLVIALLWCAGGAEDAGECTSQDEVVTKPIANSSIGIEVGIDLLTATDAQLDRLVEALHHEG